MAPDPLAIMRELGFSGAARAAQVPGGADTVIWRIEEGDRLSALRLFRPEQASMMRREVAAMTAAATAGIAVPQIRAEGNWRERPVLLLSWMPGRPLRAELRARPWSAWALGVQFGRQQAAIHTIAAPAAVCKHPTSWIAWADPDNALRTCLRAAARGPDVLLHLDFHPMNVLVSGGLISGVIDWANTRAGDPRADLARTAAILRFAPFTSGLPHVLARVVRRVLIAGWRHGYREAAGPVKGMTPFYAWAGAVMMRDLAPRLGRPELPWITPAFLEQVQRWADAWRARAGCVG